MARRIAIPHGIQALILIELTKRAGRWVDEDTLIYAVDHVLDSIPGDIVLGIPLAIGHVIADRDKWWAPEHADESAVDALLNSRGVEFVGWPQWLLIDAQEKALGEAEGRERIKLVEREDFLRVAKG